MNAMRVRTTVHPFKKTSYCRNELIYLFSSIACFVIINHPVVYGIDGIHNI